MKRKLELPALFFGLFFAVLLINPVSASAQYDDVSLETFYQELSPYGIWIDDPQYGKVWRPDVDQEEFRPYYTNGHWEMTQYGNTWVSDYEWGWAPFHYGRWHHHSRTGWVWIPGTQWGPAWVSWRSGGGYYGWAPLGPSINININIGRIPDFYWVFIPQRDIYYRTWPRYDWRRTRTIYHHTTIINNVYVYNNRNRFYTGPRVDEVRRVTRQPVVVRDVRPRPDRSEGRSNRPQVVNRTPERAERPVQSSRPDRADNNRGSVPSRAGQPVVRNSDNRIPASSQRSGRTFDNQDNRREQAARGGSERITERPVATNRAPMPQRAERAERPQQREISRSNSSRDNNRQSSGRSGSSESRGERGNAGGRPSRGH